MVEVFFLSKFYINTKNKFVLTELKPMLGLFSSSGPENFFIKDIGCWFFYGRKNYISKLNS